MLRRKYARLFPQTFSRKKVIAPYNSKIIKKLRASTQEDKRSDYIRRYTSENSISLNDLNDFSCNNPDLHVLLLEAGDILKMTTRAIGLSVYIVEVGSRGMYLLTGQQLIIVPSHYRFQIEEGKTIAAHVAFNREYVMVEDIKVDRRFSRGTGFHNDVAESVLCVPVVTPDGDCYAVFEMVRSEYDEPFSKEDLKIVIVLTGWMGAAIHQNLQRVAMNNQEILHDQLLNVTRSYYTGVITTSKMITDLVSLAKETLDVQRGSFYVIDKDKNELTADVYEEGLDEYQYQLIKKNRQIKLLQRDRGIVTIVARSGLTIKVKDPAKDPRISKEPELKSGLTIRSLLCMPITGHGGLVGIVKLLNKRYGYFTKNDEAIMKIFGIYASCCLQYNTLKERAKKLDLISIIHDRLLNMLLIPCRHEKYQAKRVNVVAPSGFLDFRWYVSEGILNHAPYLATHMIRDLIGTSDIDYNNMTNFMLVVRRLYRNNPYHNFEHAFNFMHCMYNILKRNVLLFSPMETKALLIAAICHDIDHGGCTNNYLFLTNDVIYQLYHDAPWENHHYIVSARILKIYDLFKYNSRNQKTFLNEVKEAIISTDLQQHFRNRKMLFSIVNDQLFDYSNIIHRNLMKGLMMTVCDLSGQCKPFHIAKKITENVYREFYDQGDREKQMGIIPLSMMDREKESLVPEDQIQFISVIVSPATEILRSLMPNTVDLNRECRNLQSSWQDVLNSRDRKSRKKMISN